MSDDLARRIAEALAERWTEPFKRNPECDRLRDESDETPYLVEASMDERVAQSCSEVFTAADGRAALRILTFAEVAAVAAEASGQALASNISREDVVVKKQWIRLALAVLDDLQVVPWGEGTTFDALAELVDFRPVGELDED